MSKYIVRGAGPLGREIMQVLRDTLDSSATFGYIDDRVKAGTSLTGAPVLGGISYLDSIDEPFSLILGFADPAEKSRVYQEYSSDPRISFPTIIHPTAVVSEFASIGPGTVITPFCSVQVDANIGIGVLLNVGCMVGHDTSIGDFCSIMPHCAISGAVKMGRCCLAGVKSAIHQGLHIGDGCTIGMGSVVIGNVPDGATVFGNPAKKLSR